MIEDIDALRNFKLAPDCGKIMDRHSQCAIQVKNPVGVIGKP
jgi:hypothetical protein